MRWRPQGSSSKRSSKVSSNHHNYSLQKQLQLSLAAVIRAPKSYTHVSPLLTSLIFYSDIRALNFDGGQPRATRR